MPPDSFSGPPRYRAYRRTCSAAANRRSGRPRIPPGSARRFRGSGAPHAQTAHSKADGPPRGYATRDRYPHRAEKSARQNRPRPNDAPARRLTAQIRRAPPRYPHAEKRAGTRFRAPRPDCRPRQSQGCFRFPQPQSRQRSPARRSRAVYFPRADATAFRACRPWRRCRRKSAAACPADSARFSAPPRRAPAIFHCCVLLRPRHTA